MILMKWVVAILMLAVMAVNGQLAVEVSPAKVVGQKVVVPLALKNTFAEKVESARAVVFLLDEQGKMVGQSTRWVIGGSNTNGLSAGATNTFHFLVNADKPIRNTNLTVKVSVNRIVLEGGKLADLTKEVVVTQVTK